MKYISILFVFIFLIPIRLYGQRPSVTDLQGIQRSKLFVGQVKLIEFDQRKIFVDEDENVWGYNSGYPDSLAICWLNHDLSRLKKSQKNKIFNLMSYSPRTNESCECSYIIKGEKVLLIGVSGENGFIRIDTGTEVLQSNADVGLENKKHLIKLFEDNKAYFNLLVTEVPKLFSIGLNGFVTRSNGDVYELHSFALEYSRVFKQYDDLEQVINTNKDLILNNKFNRKYFKRLIFFSPYKDKWNKYAIINPSLFTLN